MSPQFIKPSVGRVVWFHPSELTGEATFARHQDGQPYAAIIARVFDHCDKVNLTVFDASGFAHSRTSVTMWQGNGTPPGTYCEWMPYQKGQAAKTDAAEQVLAKGGEYRQPTHREELERVLLSGASAQIAHNPENAAAIAKGIKTVLDELAPVAPHPVAIAPLPVIDRPDTLVLPEIGRPDTLNLCIQKHSDERTTKTGMDLAAHDVVTGLALRGRKEVAPTDSHASAVLYPAIKRAMDEIDLDPLLCSSVNVKRAYNDLFDAFWSETPAPASEAAKRRHGVPSRT